MIEHLLIVIPAFNEERTIANVVDGCLRFGHVLVVDDGSSDRTRSVSETAGASVISNTINRGYEYSLNIGYTFAIEQHYDVMITMDADGQLPPESVPEFITAITSGANLVVGKRKNLRRFCEKALSYSSSRLSVIVDPYCGMKAYHLKAFQKDNFSTYNSIGTALAFDYVELGLRTENIAINIKERDGTSRFGRLLVSEFRLCPSMLVGQYRLIKMWIKKLSKFNA